MGEATPRGPLFWLYRRPGRGNRRPSTAPAVNPIASDRNGCFLIACAASSSLSSAVCRLLFNNRRASSNLSATAALASFTPFSSRCATSWTFFPTLAHAAGAPLARSSSKALFTWNSSLSTGRARKGPNGSGPGRCQRSPHTLRAVAATNSSLRHCSSMVRRFPAAIDAKPHSGLWASRSKGT